MDRSSLKAQFTRIGAAVVASALLLAAIAFLYWKAAPGDEVRAREVGTQLRVLQRLDARWEGLLLRAPSDPAAGGEAARLPAAASAALDALARAAAGLESPALAAGLARVTDADFVEAKLLPRVKALYEEASFYLVRVAVLQALKVRCGWERVGRSGGCCWSVVYQAWTAYQTTPHHTTPHKYAEPHVGRSVAAPAPERAGPGGGRHAGPHPQRALHGRAGTKGFVS